MKETAYDKVPYASHPYVKTHPESLYTTGRLFGLSPKEAKYSRVLEMGCAAGGNIIPMGFNYPDIEIVGIDLSKIQIDEGLKVVDELGIKNVDLKCMSILDIDDGFGKFDYILCHGIYSWVPADVRDKIMKVCARNLTENGIACVSYNTLPGWNWVRTIREMMLYHVDRYKDPAAKAEQARTLLQFILEGIGTEETPYAGFLSTELQMLALQEDAYLIHDHLEEVNHPIYFHEFMKIARELGLEYLADTDLTTMLPDNFGENVCNKLNEADDIVQTEQYMDFIRNRRFRSTLLCRGNQVIKRKLDVSDIKNFHLSTGVLATKPVDAEELEDGVALSFIINDNTLTLEDCISKTALVYLSEQKGMPVPYEKVVTETANRTGEDEETVDFRLYSELNLLRLVFADIVQIGISPGEYVNYVSDRPIATKLARYLAAENESTTNQRHYVVPLDLAERIMIQYLDGDMTINEIITAMMTHIESGELSLELDGAMILDEEQALSEMKKLCNEKIGKFAENALLVG